MFEERAVMESGATGKGRPSRMFRAACILGVTLGALACGSKRDDSSSASSMSADTSKANAAPTPHPGSLRPRLTVLFVGTSLTAGLGLDPDSAYPALIQQKIDSAGLPFTVVNAGVSGETTSGLLERLDWLVRGNFAVLVLETGANDGLRGIPASTVRANIRAALDRIKARRPDAHVLLVQMEALPNLGPKYAADFHALYPELAKEKSVGLIPFLLDGVAARSGLNQADGIHPNQKGEHLVANNVWRGLAPVLREVADSLDRIPQARRGRASTPSPVNGVRLH